MDSVSLKHNIDIILSPEFYTFMREELDINFAYQAKQIAQSLFDDYLDASIAYQYHVNKADGAWHFYAYNIEEIETFIEGKGIEKHRVSKIYFAQELSGELEEPKQISPHKALQTIEGTVTVLPLQLISEDVSLQALDLSSVKLHSGVSMGASHTSLVSLKETILLSSLFLILGGIFVVEGYRIKSSMAKDDAQLIALTDDNPTYGSKDIRESILEKYQPMDRVERQKRQTLKDISKLLSSKSELNLLKIEKAKVSAEITTSDANIIKEITQSAKAKKMKTSIVGKIVNVERSL